MNKKAQGGINDTVIFVGICIIFITFGTILPFVQHDFDSPVFTNNNGSLTLPSNPNPDTNPVTATFSWFGVFFSIAKMFVWTFGQLPIWADMIMEILRITLYLIGFRMIRGVA